MGLDHIDAFFIEEHVRTCCNKENGRIGWMAKYQEIYNRLRSRIVNKKIKANTYLPSEMELMKEFDASRDTIRKALSLLASNGYIHKEKRKGFLGSRFIDDQFSGFWYYEL